ncbi:helix-turn-helix domain-containing protein [Flavobacterium sp. CBA20B-1]|uniref:helix-turn-helix domain-containing protein n=1 Tax=unclassified Flavobacterium TaxID=196869 RepID=UPI00222486ED|nr:MULTISPECIES: helix-turn-helix domain-containing protein [unclassified Flavobacterium]WCM41954.1 helix-turn-helix domain-containing protein [Flavobacterium sp. CBA20B-1]
MKVELITKEDLESFKKELFEEIRRNRFHFKKIDQVQKEWLKSFEVRKLLGISAGTLQSLRLNGTLPYTKVGGLMYYRYEDIRKLMDGSDEKS